MSAPANRRRAAGPNDDWETPARVFEALDAEFRFTLDVAANEHNRKCERWLEGPHDDESLECTCGLCADWLEHTCWMNPPYSKVMPWVVKALVEAKCGATVVGLLPNNTELPWFTHAYDNADEIRFVQKRIQFIPSPELAALIASGEKKKSSNTGGSLVVIWRPRPLARRPLGHARCVIWERP